MINENQQKQSTDAQDPNGELISTVTATVLQILKATDQISGESRECKNNKKEPETVDLTGMFFCILERFWVVLVSAVLCGTLMGMAAKNNVTTYSATSKLYIVNKDSFGIKMADLQLGTALTSDYQEVFKTWEVHEMVIEELNLPYSYQEMQSMLTVSNPEDTRVLYITVTYPDAKMAAEIANSYAEAAKTFIIKNMDGVEPSNFSIALEPSVGYGTSVLVSAVIGSVGGGMLAVAILALLFVLDNRPRSPEVIQQYGGIDGNFEADFTGFEAIIDMVGGIDIELTSAEADYINKRNDTSIVAGLNHLNGAETLTYARARKIDSDFGRTERQRKVLMAVYEQTKNLPASELFDLMNNALPYLTTDLTDSEILSLAYRLLPLASSISISSHTVPASDCYYSANIRGMSVLVPDLPLIRQRLEEYLPLE